MAVYLKCGSVSLKASGRDNFSHRDAIDLHHPPHYNDAPPPATPCSLAVTLEPILMRFSSSPRALVLAGLSTLTLAIGCTRPPPKRPEAPPAPVVITTVGKKSVPVLIRSIGIVKPVSIYSVKPRVNGELTQVHFTEGDDVKKGQKLFTIDPRPYEIAVEEAAAALARDKSVLGGAMLDLDRVDRAMRTGVASREDLDTAQTAVAKAKSTVAADEAVLASANLQLSFTTITSPIDGRTGQLQVTPGNLVSPTDIAPLATVVQITPIDVVFSIPEQLLPQVEEARKKGPLKVTVIPRNGESPVPGVLAFSDNTVDTTTGTIQLKAAFKNEDRKLWPGQFLDVVLTTGERPESVVVPSSAIQSGQAGPYVYLVGNDNKAELRLVKIAFQEGGEAVIDSGLQGNEKVVVEGQLRLAPGLKVDVKQSLPPAQAAAAAQESKTPSAPKLAEAAR